MNPLTTNPTPLWIWIAYAGVLALVVGGQSILELISRRFR